MIVCDAIPPKIIKEAKLKIFIAALLSISTLALAEPEQPFDFKGLVLNSEFSDIEKNTKYSCEDVNTPLADKQCIQKGWETIAGAPVKLVMLWFISGKLQTIAISVDEGYFTQLAEALNEKYGKVKYESNVLKNRMGAEFENKIYTWHKASSTLKLTRYSGKLDVSSVFFTLDSSAEVINKRSGVVAKEKAKDL